MTEDELRELIHKYLERIQITNDFFELYEHLNNSKSEYLNEMNYSPAFFSLVMHSLQESAFIELPKLFDCRADTGLKNLLCICFKNSNLFRISYKEFNKEIAVNIQQEIVFCEVKLLEAEDSVNKVKRYRDKYFAHLEKKYLRNPDKINQDFHLTVKDFRDLLKTATEICNSMLVNLGNKGELGSTQASNVFDIDEIF